MFGHENGKTVKEMCAEGPEPLKLKGKFRYRAVLCQPTTASGTLSVVAK